MTDERRPQPHPGRLGHVAHLQQFDTAAPWSPAPAASGAAQEPERPPAPYAEPTAIKPPRAYGVAAVPSPVVDVVAPEIYQMVPSAAVTEVVIAPPAFVARIPTSIPVARPRPVHRRLRLAVATTVAACALAAVGVGYVALTRTGESTQAIAPDGPGLPSVDGTLPADGVVPGAKPTGALPLSPSAAAPRTTATSGASLVPAGAVEGETAVPSAQDSTDDAGATATPEESPAVLRPPPAPAMTQAPALSADLSYTARERDNGISGYVGTVVLDNPGGSADGSWQVTLTVPGGNLVSGRGPVEVSQRGESVVFTPSGAGGAVPAGGSLSFTFTIRGVLSALPHGCTIDGRACS